MDLERVEAALAREPFEPLRIQLASGTFCDVRHPDSAFVHDHQLLIVDRVALGARAIRTYHFLDPQLVTRVTPLRLAAAELPGGADAEPDREIILPAARTADWLESLLALVATGLICAVVGFSGISIYLNLGRGSPAHDALALLAWAVLMAVEVMLLLRVARFYRRRLYPLPLLYALAHDPPRPAAARLALVGFWLAHAVAGVLAFAWVERFFSAANAGRPLGERWLDDVVLLVFVTAGAHASMSFVLLAARAAGATPRTVRRLWRFRVLIDVLVVAGIWLFPQWLAVPLAPLNALTRNLRYLLGG